VMQVTRTAVHRHVRFNGEHLSGIAQIRGERQEACWTGAMSSKEPLNLSLIINMIRSIVQDDCAVLPIRLTMALIT